MNQRETLPWDLLRDVLSLSRHDSLRAAARARGMSHAALSRHLTELERILDLDVVHRTSRGVQLTEAGEEIAASAARIEAEIHALSLKLAGASTHVAGTVRIALPELMVAVLSEPLRELHEAWPELKIELVMGVGTASLTQREADLAIRVQAEPAEHLVGRRIGTFTKAAYCAKHLELGPDPGDWPWIDWDLAYRHLATSRWLHETHPEARVVAHVDSAHAMLELTRRGVGVGMLPTLIASQEPGLRMCAPLDLEPYTLWLLTHPELRRVPRVRTVMRALASHLSLWIQGEDVG